MARYDWGWGRGYDMGFGAGRARRRPRQFDRWEGGPPPGPPREYGPDHPRFGGYPGAPERGMYYGGYDAGFRREPFIPETAYRRHPKLERSPHRSAERWFEGGRPERPAALDDHEIRQGVRENLYGDSWLEADRLDVEVSDGVVTLRGEVDDYLQARYAWDDAWESAGVRGVINQITVRTDRPSETKGDVMPQNE